jgi:hypothetical protein
MTSPRRPEGRQPDRNDRHPEGRQRDLRPEGSGALLALARTLLDRSDPKTAGLWPRAAALLGRQALEQALDAYWTGRGIALDACATRPQLLCLRSYLPDASLAARVHHTWSALSDACHHHAYELAPTADELGTLFDTVGDLLAAVEKGSAA